MNILVLHDFLPADAPPDLADNLVQALEVENALKSLKHRVTKVAFDEQLEDVSSQLSRLKPEVVFNLVETPLGQARMIHLVPLLLDRQGFAYTGAGTKAMLNTSNKLLAKKTMAKAGLPTPQWLERPLKEDSPQPGLTYLVKSIWEHGSVGLDRDCLVSGKDGARLKELLDSPASSDAGERFAEQYIEGREFNISLLAGVEKPQVLPEAEIVFENFGPGRPRLVDYRAKWDEKSFEHRHTKRRFDFPARDRVLLKELNALSLRCWRLFGLRGWARVDFRVDEEGRPWILEVNANPCIAADAGFMAAAGRAGLDQPGVVARILADIPRHRGTNPQRTTGGNNLAA